MKVCMGVLLSVDLPLCIRPWDDVHQSEGR